MVGQNTTYTALPDGPLYTQPVAKRGYTRDTIRGGASEWDVSRPLSSYARTLAMLLVHPVRFFELLPRIPDMRAPALFLLFSGLPAAILWLLFWGLYPALVALVLPLPLSFLLAGLYHLGVLSGRHGYVVTWRVLAYPLGFYLSLAAVPMLGPLGAAYSGLVIMPLGLAEVHEVGRLRAVLFCAALGVVFGAAYYFSRVA
ncbi:MAG TPA: hypothetical protein VNT12_00395 [Rubrobacter sp.]|jgi:hypothetical protein|nr:hypothetical protein [Rubrobacter sp.]